MNQSKEEHYKQLIDQHETDRRVLSEALATFDGLRNQATDAYISYESRSAGLVGGRLKEIIDLCLSAEIDANIKYTSRVKAIDHLRLKLNEHLEKKGAGNERGKQHA